LSTSRDSASFSFGAAIRPLKFPGQAYYAVPKQSYSAVSLQAYYAVRIQAYHAFLTINHKNTIAYKVLPRLEIRLKIALLGPVFRPRPEGSLPLHPATWGKRSCFAKGHHRACPAPAGPRSMPPTPAAAPGLPSFQSQNYKRGSTGSLSRARTPKTHSWTRRSGS
jgi:hypothetical protein